MPILPRRMRHVLALTWWAGLVWLFWTLLTGDIPFALEPWATRLGLPLVLGTALLARQLTDPHPHPGLLPWLRAHSSSYTKVSPTVLSEQLASQPDGTSARVSIKGKVAGDGRETAPLSGRQTAAWRLELELLEPADRLWSPLARGPILDALAVRATEAKLAVEALGVSLDVPADATLYGVVHAETMPWSELGSHPALAKIVEAALVEKGLTREGFSGVRAIESRLAPGDAVTICGEAKRIDGRIAFGPGSVVLTGDPRPPILRRELLGGVARRAGAVALFALGIAATLNQRKAGGIDYIPPAEDTLLFEVDHGGDAPGVTILDWRLTPDQGASQKTLYVDSKPAIADGTMKIRLQRATTEKTDSLAIGKDGRIAWTGDRWFLDLPLSGLPTELPASTEAERKGVLSIRNRTSDRVGVILRDEKGESLGTWIFDPGDGATEPLGNKLVDSDVAVETKPGYTLELTRERRDTLCEATLASCPLASFDRGHRRWLITPR